MAAASIIFLRVRTNILNQHFDGDEKQSISISEMTGLLFGKTAVLVYNGFTGFAIFGINVLFFLFFIQTASSLYVVEDPQIQFYIRVTIAVLLFAVQAPVCLKREISELSFQSYLQPVGIFAVLMILANKASKSSP